MWWVIMVSHATTEQFSQIHIDVARNATDDFNLFHDSHGWSRIINNPFQGPIVLGFQIEALIEHKMRHHRHENAEENWLTQKYLNFSNYQFSFANAIKPETSVSIEIKKTQITDGDNPTLSNRVSVKSNGKLALIGFKKETQTPIFLNHALLNGVDFPGSDIDLRAYADRSFLNKDLGGFFLKRKFMNISNAKNFLCGSLIDQRIFFDELEGRHNFPEIFPCAFISCALLEKALHEKLDFEKSPMVYSSHKISIDRFLLSQLKSNSALHILIRQQHPFKQAANPLVQVYECYGLIDNNEILFRAIVELTPLEAILKK